jgi:4-amino-4-deoxy-L-arabinose transferase-like glycosyltransferase
MMSIWFVPITLKYGAQFWDEFFLQHHLMRYTSSQYHQSGGPFFYIPVLIVGTFPWTFAPLLGLPKADNPRKRLLICLSLCWFLSTLIFFSLSSSKLPGYILPAIPAYAMLCALSIVDFFRRPSATRKKPILILILLNLVFIPALLIGGAARPALHFPIVVMSTCVVVITFLTGVLITKKQFANALSMYALLAVTAAVLTVQEAPARLHWYESKLLSSQIQPVLSRGVKLALYNVYDFSFVFYTNGRVDLTPKGYFIPLRNYVDLHRYVTAKGEALVLVGNEELTWMQQADFWKVVHIFRGNERSIVQIAARTH